MENNKQNYLIYVAMFIMAAMLLVMWCQNKQIDVLKDIINKQDTTVTVKSDTIFEEKIITDSIPTEKTVTILKYDTIYKQVGDTLYMQPIMLKKKIIKK